VKIDDTEPTRFDSSTEVFGGVVGGDIFSARNRSMASSKWSGVDASVGGKVDNDSLPNTLENKPDVLGSKPRSRSTGFAHVQANDGVAALVHEVGVTCSAFVSLVGLLVRTVQGAGAGEDAGNSCLDTVCLPQSLSA